MLTGAKTNHTKVGVCGKFACGKTSLVRALMGEDFQQYKSTILDTVTLDVEDKKVIVYDTAGMEHYNSLTVHILRMCDVILYCREEGEKKDEEMLTEYFNKTIICVITKCDFGATHPGELATSAKIGLGIDKLKVLLYCCTPGRVFITKRIEVPRERVCCV